MTWFLILLFAIAFGYLSYRQPVWALSAIALFLPTYQIRFDFWLIPMTLLELMILILTFVWLANVLIKKSKIVWGGYWWLIILWLAVALFSAIISPNLLSGLGAWKAYFLEAILVYLLIINLCRDKKSLDLILNGLFLGAFLMSIMAIVQRFTGWLVPDQYWYLGEGQRVTGFFGVPNFLSLYLGPIMGLLLGKIFFIKSKIDKQKIFYILTFALAFLAIFFAKSEGALVAVPGALLIFGLLNKKTRILSASIILIGVILYFSIPNIQSELLSRLDPSQNWSVFIRTQIWSESWQMLKDNWLLGAGLAGYQQAIVPYHTADYFEIFLYPHNLIMNFWSEMGLTGLILFLILIIKFFVDGYKLIKQKISLEYVWGAILAMLIFAIHGLVDHPYFKNDLSVIFWIIIAVLAWVKVDSQKMKP